MPEPRTTGAYPAHREADVPLRDGSTVRIRPVRPDDYEALHGFLSELSGTSRWFRFFSGSPNLEQAARWAADVDYESRYGLMARAGAEVLGHAAYQVVDGDRAEVAFAVADRVQGRGVGTILLGHLAEAAADGGVAVFEAEVLPENHKMIGVFRESGFPVKMRLEPGVIRVEFPTSITAEGLQRFERREQMASVAAMRNFLSPRSVAVIGASRTRGTIGGEVFHNLLDASFNGPVYPVNPKAEVVQSVAAYPSVTEIPGPVDLGVIVVPAEGVLEVAGDCARKGVKTLVVISAGFSEIGEDGIVRQRRLLEICRDSGMRLIGPNCMGILNTAGEVRLNATFAPRFPPAGRVGFLSQSGALGLAVIDYAQQLSLGLSSFVSVGNKADISGNDLIQYWEDDEDTDLILLYLESFGNPRKFGRLSQRVGKSKPIVVVKSGRTSAGARATGSHTGALIAASDVTVDALFRQAGVIRTDTLAELFDVASLLANQPPPRGRRVGILTNAGGPGILCADACEAHGLEVGELPAEVRAELSSFLPPEASLTNPVDMIASASAEDYRRSISVMASSEAIDAIVVIFIPPLVTLAEDVARAIRTAVVQLPKPLPVLSVFMSAHGVPDELRAADVRIPSYAFPEDAARALARVVDHGIWREQRETESPSLGGFRRDEAAAVIASGLSDAPRWLNPEEVARLFDCYGLPLAEWRVVATPEEAGEAAASLKGPVALKAVSSTLIHKSDVGGVRLDLAGGPEVSQAARDIEDGMGRIGHALDGFLVQQMVPMGVEMLVGVVHDQSFGPVVACGAGGVAVELLKDVQVRLTPLSERDAEQMIRSLATFPLLDGYRGAPRADVEGLKELLLRVGALVEEHPEIVEMDCNPVKVTPEGAVIVDARVRVQRSEPPLPLAARRRV
ncbi:MAG: GNAT family N-acetyltransferase [Actinomycetota bacterium]